MNVETQPVKFLYKFFEPSDLKLEMKPEVLASLLANGQIHATDFRCLDIGSKQIVWKMLLSLAKSKWTKHEQSTHCLEST